MGGKEGASEGAREQKGCRMIYKAHSNRRTREGEHAHAHTDSHLLHALVRASSGALCILNLGHRCNQTQTRKRTETQTQTHTHTKTQIHRYTDKNTDTDTDVDRPMQKETQTLTCTKSRSG